MKRPAFQFYPADWRNDAGLKLCSLSARGLWIEMICIMHAAEPYGHLCAAGRPLDTRDLSKLVGESERDVKRWLEELVRNSVCSTSEGAIVSRRMVRDESLRERRAAGGEAGSEFGHLGAEHGKKGGRPRKETGDKKPPFNPPPSSSSSSSEIQEPNGSVGNADRLPRCDTQSVVELYHEILPELPTVRLMNDNRRKAISAFWRFVLTSKKSDGTPRATNAEEAMAWIRGYFGRARDNDFLMGRGHKAPGHEGWQCDFDFLLTEKGKKHVIEKTKEAA